MPRIGLLSDSHGRVEPTRLAVALLVSHGAEQLLHLGDIGTEAVLDELVTTVPASLVFGNNDDPADLTPHARSLGLLVAHPVGRLTLPGGDLVFTHGDDQRAFDEALRSGVRYLCHGHTHLAADRRRGTTRIINPGALHRAARHTVALLDTTTDGLAFYPVAPR